MDFKDYYQIMGVARDATDAEVKQAYRRLARKFHPDVSKEKDAEARFKELGEAYEVLKSPQKRAAYDQLGSGPRPGEEFQPPPDWGAGFEFSEAGPGGAGRHGAGGAHYSDFFDSLFRGAAASAGASDRGDREQHAKVMLDLDAALHGGSRTLNLGERVLNVQIPQGILAGQTIRLAGQAAGQKGDLYIEVDFLAHPLYRVVGRDLYLDLPVAPWEAALGASVKTPTPAGAVDLKIPAGSHGGTTLRLKGRGIPATPPGDLYALLDIALPAAQSDGAKAAYRAFADALPFNPRTQLGVLS